MYIYIVISKDIKRNFKIVIKINKEINITCEHLI